MGLVARTLSIFGVVRSSHVPEPPKLVGVPSILPAPPSRDAEDLAARLRAAASAPSWRPPVPPRAALELLSIYRRPNVTFVEMANVIERDPALAARVLRIAASPLYSPRQPPTTLRDAAVRLGLDTLTSIVWEAAMNARVFHAPEYENAMKRLQKHATAVARIGRAMARAIDEDGEEAFLAGLLHDIGIGAGLALAAQAHPDRRAELRVVEDALALCHEEIGSILAQTWGLPGPIAEALSVHHEPPPVAPRLALVVALSDRIANEAGLSVAELFPSHLDRQAEDASAEAAALLGITPSMVELLRGTATGLAYDPEN